MAKLTSRKLKGSTLIEVLIAMVIIMLVFSIAIKIFNNVMQSAVAVQKVKVQNQLDSIAAQVKKDGFVTEKSLVLDSVAYELVNDTSALMGIAKLEIKAKQNGRLLGSLKCLYQVKDETEN